MPEGLECKEGLLSGYMAPLVLEATRDNLTAADVVVVARYHPRGRNPLCVLGRIPRRGILDHLIWAPSYRERGTRGCRARG